MSEKWEQVDQLFHSALELALEDRAAFLDQACGGDEALRREVESLLDADEDSEGLTAKLPVQVAAEVAIEMFDAEQPHFTSQELIGHYRVLSRLGQGGMGEVFLAEDTRLKRKVAIKMLPAEFNQDLDRVRRFQQEARIISALNHPNIITIHEIGALNQAHFIVTELIAGQTLRHQMTGTPIAAESALDWATQIAAGLDEAHSAGVIHRDIKPENIMLRPDGIVKVLDFGLAKLTQAGVAAESETPEKTAPGMVMGTVSYMSPEQARGLEVDARTDIFSLGVVLYELLTGHRPFEGATISDVLAAILMTEPQPLARFCENPPVELEEIVARALVKDLDRRYQTIRDLHLDLKNLRQELEFAARIRPSSSSEKKRQIETNRTATVVLSPTAPQPCANISLPPTALIGRENELAAAKQLLLQDDVRLLTLTGPGGSGKTRLSLQIAFELITEFTDGVWFVPLAAISDPDLTPSAIIQSLGVKENAHNSLQTSLKEFLKGKRMLIVLDNFEQLLAAAPMVTDLLAACPQIKVLITSRAALKVRVEREFPVPPLSIPSLDGSMSSLMGSPAVELFAERARAVKADFELTGENARIVGEICARLDGLPLALELAAARIRVLTPRAMLQRLNQSLKLLSGGARDMPERQQTIRNTIKWSYDLLSEEEQTLFRQLAVFVGGFTLEAAEEVCQNAGKPQIDVLDGVGSLLDKSLLQQKEQADGEPRFSMLMTIKEFGLELLETSGERAAAEAAHTTYFLALVEEAEPQLTGAEVKIWLDRLDLEHDNLRAAIQRALQNGEAETLLRLGGALWRFWTRRSHFREGRERLAALLKATESAGPTELRAKALTGAATLEQNQGDYEVARILFEEVLSIRRALGDKPGIAAALTSLGWVAWRQNEYERSRALSEEAVALYQGLGNQRGANQARNTLAWVAHHQGDFERARVIHEECIRLQMQLGDQHRLAFYRGILGWTLQKLGRLEEAVLLVDEALNFMRELGDRQMIGWFSGHRGKIALEQGDHAQAFSLLEDSRSIFTEIGDRYGLAHPLSHLGEMRLQAGDYEAAKAFFRESLKMRLAVRDRYSAAECLERLAWVAEAENQPETAARLLGATEALRELLGVRLGATEQPVFTQLKQAVIDALGADRFTALQQEGQLMEIESFLS